MDLRLLFQITTLCSVEGKSFKVIWKVRLVGLVKQEKNIFYS